MKEIMSKFKSDRLWALVLFVLLVIADAAFDLKISDDSLSKVMWAVISFIAGKSIRGSAVGGVIEALAPRAFAIAEAVVPDVRAKAAPIATKHVKAPEDAP